MRFWLLLTLTLFASGLFFEPLAAEVPLMKQTLGDSSVRLKREQLRLSAEQAMRVGLYPLAVRLYGRAREGLEVNSPPWREITLRLVDALVSAGRFDEVGLVMDSIESDSDSRYRLRVAIRAYIEERVDAAETALGMIDEVQLLPEERPWRILLEGMIAEARGDHALAADRYQGARDQALDAVQAGQFEAWIYRHRLLFGKVDESLLQSLKEQSEDFSGKSAGFTFAREYAIALYKLGRQSEAMVVLERQLALARSKGSDAEDTFLLLIALTAGEQSERAKIALETLLKKGKGRVWQRIALRQLLSTADNEPRRKELLELLKSLIDESEGHVLVDELLLARAQLLLAQGDIQMAREDAQRIIEGFPGSVIYTNALELLASLSLSNEPPQYRTAADFLSRLRDRLPKGIARDRAGLLVGDCYYQNKDYTNAADVYQQVYQESRASEWGARALFQYVMSQLEQGELDKVESVLNNAISAEKGAPLALWQAEWNFVSSLREDGQQARALERTRSLLREYLVSMPAELALRLMWLEASLAMVGPEVAIVPEIADNILGLMEGMSNAQIDGDEKALIVANTLLLKAQALFRLDRGESAQQTVKYLRESYPQSNSAMRSYIDEARFYVSQGKLIEAQQRFIQLADKYPQGRYADIALYEAALTAEQQGLQRTYEEAAAILERLITGYESSPLAFYARVGQGDLLRKLNQFGAAQSRYEEVLRLYPEHPGRYEVQMALAYSLLAQARNDPARMNAAIAQLERLYDLPHLPSALRVEAGFQWAHALNQQEQSERAEDIYWQLVTRFLLERSDDVEVAQTGDYWLARALFELAAIYEQEGRVADALKLYDLILDYSLPGAATARARKELYENTSE